MRQESGRSMLEIVGVLAIGVIMIASAYNMYKSIDQRQKRLVASETIEDVAKKTKILYEFSGYTGVSITKLVNKGAISDARPPIGSSWKLESVADGEKFQIVLNGLTYDECEYFLIKKADWAESIALSTGKDCIETNTVIFTSK